MELHLLHPIAVHAPITLLPLGFALACLAGRPRIPAWVGEAVPWLLWLGTASAWAALGLGLLAERTAPHVPAAWETLAEHETLAWWTVGLFSALSVCRFWLGRRKAPPRAGMRLAFLAAWLAACGVLAATGFHGGELVFAYGMGIRGR